MPKATNAAAARIGIAANHAAAYHADGVGTQAVYAAMADATCMMRCESSLADSRSEAIDQDRASRKQAV